MKTCVIFCAGGFSALAEPIDEEDLDEQIIQEMMDEDDREGEEIWNRISGKNSRNTKNTKRNRNAR